MRGADRQTAAMFSDISPETLVPQDHPLRAIRPLVNAALERLSGRFERMYAPRGRDSIAPEKLRRALLLQALFSVRSERHLMQQITYDMMFRWVELRGSPVFVGLSMDAPVWDVTVFTKNRDRLLAGDIARGFLAAILVDPQVEPLLSDEPFSVDGTLIEAWASMKSLRPKDGSGEPPTPGRNGEVDFRGEPREPTKHTPRPPILTRGSISKAAGQAAKLCHMGHVLMERPVCVVVLAISCTMTWCVSSGLPRQFWVMNANRRCSMRFHLLVPGGKCATVISSPIWSASACSSVFHSRTRTPLLLPQSAVITRKSFRFRCSRVASGQRGWPSSCHQRQMLSTCHAGER